MSFTVIVMDSQSFRATELLLPELNYELRIRDVITDKPHADKRKILGRLLAKEKQQGFDTSLLVDKNFDFIIEKSEIESTLTSIESLISDFEGPTTDSCFRRANGRLNHVIQRIKRIKLDPTTPDAISKFKNEAYASALSLEADLFDRVKEPETFLNTTVLNSTLPNTTACNPIVIPSPSKTIQVYKFGIQFDGNPKSVLSFVERVEEIAFARGVSKTDLFQSASDLFKDKATFWFRQIKSSVNDWDSLVQKLKKDFLVADFDEEIWNQIKNRKQGKYESVVLYLACMETLFSRLSHSSAEVTKIKYMKLGLQPEYQRRLALSDINSIETLSNLCKKLEEADILSLASTSSSHRGSIDTELAYISDEKFSKVFKNKNHPNKSKEKFIKPRTNFNKNKTDNKNQNRSSQASTNNNKPLNVNAVDSRPDNVTQGTKIVACWSCGQPNHTFRNCLASRKSKFCFKCGCPNTTAKDCNRCTGNGQ